MRRAEPLRAVLSAVLCLLAGAALPVAAQAPTPAAGPDGTPSDGTPTVVLALEEGKASERRNTRLLRQGAVDAAEDQGVTLDVRQLRGETATRVDLIERVLEDRPDGLVLATADPGRFADAIAASGPGGAAVVLAWDGIDEWRDLGASAYVGVDEIEVGRRAGAQLAELGATNVLCAIDNVTDQRLDDRCEGARAALEASGARMDLLRALDPPGDPTGVRDAIASRLFDDPTFDAVLATEDDTVRWGLEALARTGRSDDVLLATFDPAPAILAALADGDVAFAVETQPYLQGYLPVVFLSQWARRGLMPGAGEPILTGPRLVTQEDATRRLRSAGG